MKFSKQELGDLFTAWLIISLAFAILFSGGISMSLNLFIISFIISIFTVGVSFLLHELAHKYVAQKYSLWAEFRAFYEMLFLALLLSFFGFIIATPGAVVIKGWIDKKKNGKISLAGPLTNILLTLIFFILIMVFKISGIFGIFLKYGITINSLLALFNMVPLAPFDGKKVYEWNKMVYIFTTVFALLLFLSALAFWK